VLLTGVGFPAVYRVYVKSPRTFILYSRPSVTPYQTLVSREKIRRLHKAMRDVLYNAIDLFGATMSLPKAQLVLERKLVAGLSGGMSRSMLATFQL